MVPTTYLQGSYLHRSLLAWCAASRAGRPLQVLPNRLRSQSSCIADHVCCSLQCREFIRVVAFLHSVDYKKVGLGAYGKEGSYYARQVRPATLVGVDHYTQ